mmetsp:Transcript_14900/g.20858  ORF Transcript_14900/g.20858 Transcript_14900/m.20858 type:complete len:373 (-) Transcript_14900:540-1658(-)|eukprot:jgi/Bigna1/85551/estExt_fgenesh1_pg.C_40343
MALPRQSLQYVSKENRSSSVETPIRWNKSNMFEDQNGASVGKAATWPVTKEQENLYRVTYTSRIRDSTFSVMDIVRQSKENNTRLGIGGVLQYNQSTGEITQILEGEEGTVKGLLDTINGDWRHCCVEIKQEEWPKKRVWHKWGGMLLSHGGHWKVVRSPCNKNMGMNRSPPTLRLRPKRSRGSRSRKKNKRNACVPIDKGVDTPDDDDDLVITPFGHGRLVSFERDGIMKIQLKFGVAYIHQSKLALPPRARAMSDPDMQAGESKQPNWTVALIDRSCSMDGEQHLMYVFTRKPVGLVFFSQTLKISETRMDATAAGIKQGDILLEIDGKSVSVDSFPLIYKSTIVPFSMKFFRPKPTSCTTCRRGTCAIS